VDDAFEVPLSFLMDPANHGIAPAAPGRTAGALLLCHAAMKSAYIWGVTAGIIRALYERLYA
jgi:hypothetical protein